MCITVLCLPVLATAADSPWSLEMQAGIGTMQQSLDESGLDEPMGPRVLVAQREVASAMPAGSLGGTVRYRCRDRVDAYLRVDWRDAARTDLEADYDFANGDHQHVSSGDGGEMQSTWVMAGVRWSMPVGTGWLVEVSGDLRHLDTDLVDEVASLPPLPSRTRKTEASAVGAGLGGGVRWQLADGWAVALTTEAARVDRYLATATTLALVRRIR